MNLTNGQISWLANAVKPRNSLKREAPFVLLTTGKVTLGAKTHCNQKLNKEGISIN